MLLTLYSYATFASDKILDKSAILKFPNEMHINEHKLYYDDYSKGMHDIYM